MSLDINRVFFERTMELLCRSLIILKDMVDPNECTYDHHGYCQEHGWLTKYPPCPHRLAKELLIETKRLRTRMNAADEHATDKANRSMRK